MTCRQEEGGSAERKLGCRKSERLEERCPRRHLGGGLPEGEAIIGELGGRVFKAEGTASIEALRQPRGM